MSNPKIKVTGKVSDFDKVEKNEVKEKQSNFFLTINTNQVYKDNDANLKNDTDIFNDLINNVCNHIDEYVTLSEGHTFDKNVNDVDVEYIVELAPKTKSLHAHIFLKFKHNTNLKLDYKKFKGKICKELGLHNIFFSNKVARGSHQSIQDYLNKYAPTK